MTVLTAQKRDEGSARAARTAGLLPAVVYGRKEKSTPIAIPLVNFQKAFREAGESTVITLEGLGEPKDVLIQEVAYDALSGLPLHADFYAIEKGQTVTVSVPLQFEGVSPAVKELGGILTKVMHELEVEAQPKDLPHFISVPIEKLDTLESQIHVSDLVLPAGVTAEADGNDVVAMISVAVEEKEEVAPVDLSAIEVEKKGKKEEEGAALAAAGEADAGKGKSEKK